MGSVHCSRTVHRPTAQWHVPTRNPPTQAARIERYRQSLCSDAVQAMPRAACDAAPFTIRQCEPALLFSLEQNMQNDVQRTAQPCTLVDPLIAADIGRGCACDFRVGRAVSAAVRQSLGAAVAALGVRTGAAAAAAVHCPQLPMRYTWRWSIR
jgi:hypothetical protein